MLAWSSKMQQGSIKSVLAGLSSPGLPVIGMGIFSGLSFWPETHQENLRFGWAAVTACDYSCGRWSGRCRSKNPSDDEIKVLVNDPYYDRIVKLFIPLQMAANLFAGYVVTRRKCIDARPNIIGCLHGGN